MVLRSGFCCFLLMLPFILTRTSSAAKVEIDIVDELPRESNDALVMRCGEEAALTLKVGEHHKVRLVDSDKDVECTAMWGRFFTGWWTPYNKTRDAPHLNLFWSVQQDGFYRSWDGISNWQKIDVWYTE